jgi:hypothetical protein
LAGPTIEAGRVGAHQLHLVAIGNAVRGAEGVDALLEVSKLAARVQSVPAGLVLFARGSRMVPTVTLVMLAQAETVAAPV